MCGIAGIFDFDISTHVSPDTVQRMCDAIFHRGPDSEGYWIEGNVALGMRRLSIIDVSGGNQPIHNEDKSVWVILNGEIYNFAQLRPELEQQGHCFHTNSDTEVIVHLYEQYGNDCISKLRGMFAFALYDANRNALLLARDRLGKKPLHYATHRERFLFASEIKSLLAAEPALAEIDHEALYDFFRFSYIPDPDSAFAHIRKLPPGHAMEVTSGGVRIWKYWELPAYDTCDFSNEEECLEELEHKLAEAVRLRLISDVPLGALLSGGVDSSLVVAMMARASNRPVKTFSIGFGKPDFDESHHGRKVAARFATDHQELRVEPDIRGTLDWATRHMEEPFGDASIIPTYHVCRLARQHVTVALCGDGGDELLAGYPRYQTELQRQWFDMLPRPLGAFYRKHIHRLLPEQLPGRRFLYNLSCDARDRYIDSISFLPPFERERSIFTDDFLLSARDGCRGLRRLQKYYDSNSASSRLSKMMQFDTKAYLPFALLTKVDRMSMANSLEVRAPLLDHHVVEWAAALHYRWKLRDGEPKYILKKLALRMGVPPEVLYRPKQGFCPPLAHWMKQEFRHELLEVLLDRRTEQRGFFAQAGLHRMLKEHLDGVRDHSSRLWQLLIFELWQRNFVDKPQRAQRGGQFAASGVLA